MSSERIAVANAVREDAAEEGTRLAVAVDLKGIVKQGTHL
jgi:hypothetical protein